MIIPPQRSNTQYCDESCAVKYRSRKQRERANAKLPPIKCKICNTDIIGKSRSVKYCSAECKRKQACIAACAYAKKKVKENHAKKPPKHCKTCNVQLVTTPRNYHTKEFCSPCAQKRKDEVKAKFLEKNKDKMQKYYRERYIEKRQNPEFVEQSREKSRLRRINNPVIVNCVICEKEFKRIRYQKCCSDKCSEINKKNQLTKWSTRISARLSKGIRKCATKGIISEWTWEVLDFTIDELKEKFESQFYNNTETGEEMTWDNISDWHIDHIVPKASFSDWELSNPSSDGFKICWSLGNLRPLWAKDNLRKGDKLPGVDYI